MQGIDKREVAIRVDGFKRPVSLALVRTVTEMSANGVRADQIAKTVGINTCKARAIISKAGPVLSHDDYITQGAAAPPGSRCPYGISEIGLRCAWLAGHYDRHGFLAWEMARQ